MLNALQKLQDVMIIGNCVQNVKAEGDTQFVTQNSQCVSCLGSDKQYRAGLLHAEHAESGAMSELGRPVADQCSCPEGRPG